jgi:uncharacterized protein (TIRG00374 family)
MKSRKFWIKFFITVSTLLWFFSRVRLAPLLDRLSHVNWATVAAAFLVSSVWVLPSAARWKRLARACGYPIGLGASIRLYVIGSFFNAFLPTGTGGDVARGYMVSKEKEYPLGAMWGIVFVERIIGFAVSLVLVFFTGLIFFSNIVELKAVLISSFVLLAGMIAGWIFLSSKKFQNPIRILARKATRRSFREGASDLARVIQVCRQDPRAMISSICWTAINQATQIIGGFMISRAIVDFDVSSVIFWVVIPLSFVSQLLPSIGGYGVREAGFIVFFGWFGIHPEPAACFGVLRLLYLWCFSLAGGILYLFGKQKTDVKAKDNKTVQPD